MEVELDDGGGGLEVVQQLRVVKVGVQRVETNLQEGNTSSEFQD